MTEENKNMEQPQGAAQAQPEEMPAALKIMIGRKVGMTQMFNDHGELYGVSVVEAGPCRVVRTRTKKRTAIPLSVLASAIRRKAMRTMPSGGYFPNSASTLSVI